MTSDIIWAKTTHTRFSPKYHSFSYPVFVFRLTIDELPVVSQNVKGFSWNTPNILSISEDDYLMDNGQTIKNKVMDIALKAKLSQPIHSIQWITSPKYFNYGFNPLSVYECFGKQKERLLTILEVHNTYKDRHVYVSGQLVAESKAQVFKIDKVFHVSPFFDEEGSYIVRTSSDSDYCNYEIEYQIDGKKVFFANLVSQKVMTLNTINVWKSLIRFPLAASLTMPRILFQAAKLYYVKRLPVKSRPIPISEGTVSKRKPTIWQSFCQSIFFKTFRNTQYGTINLRGPNNEQWSIGSGDPTQITVEIHDYVFFSKLIRSGEIGLGESFTNGDWTSDQCAEWLVWLIKNEDSISVRMDRGGFVSRLVNGLMHSLRSNTKLNSKKNIQEHYCLSNDFYKSMLDPTMMYSSAVFNQPKDDLEHAQRHKIDSLIELGNVKPNHHVLEIGTGWGTFAIELVKKTDCKVTTVTLSNEQYVYAKKRIKTANLEDKITVKKIDYRDLKGTFDRVFSIEMIEAVGHKYLGAYIKKLNECCAHDGAVVLQAICIPDQVYDTYRRKTDWIKKHIFPGGHLPSLHILLQKTKDLTNFNLINCKNIASHYAQTLRCWRTNIGLNLDDIKQQGFDQTFLNKWLFYLNYCEAAFESRYLMTYQMVLTRPKNAQFN